MKRHLIHRMEQHDGAADDALPSSKRVCGLPSACAWDDAPPSRINSLSVPVSLPRKLPDIQGDLAQELKQLSMEEQEEIHKDITGDIYEVHEDAKMVSESLEQLEKTLTSIRKKTAYDRALFLRPLYVRNESFRLMFLRADCFDIPLTAKRLIHHFEVKQQLFGIDKLVKNITWDDLNSDDQDACLTGSNHVFPGVRDVHGRILVQQVFSVRRFAHRQNQYRAVWWMLMTAIFNDEMAQKRGAVIISYAYKMNATSLYQIVSDMLQSNFMDFIPLRLRAAHICLDNQSFLKPIFMATSGPLRADVRRRIRGHFGSHLECQYALGAFGISKKVTPLDDSSIIRVDLFVRRLGDLQRRQKVAESDAQIVPARIEYPCSKDVLLGRGYPFQQFSGNVKMLDLVRCLKPQHDAATLNRRNKTAIASKVVDAIKEQGGRFLKRSDSGKRWMEVDDSVAREKAAMGFRNLSRKNNSEKKQVDDLHTASTVLNASK